MKIQFDSYSISVSDKEVSILNRLLNKNVLVESFSLDDWVIIDLLWKKIGFGKTKTDTNANKKAPNEPNASNFIIKDSLI